MNEINGMNGRLEDWSLHSFCSFLLCDVRRELDFLVQTEDHLSCYSASQICSFPATVRQYSCLLLPCYRIAKAPDF